MTNDFQPQQVPPEHTATSRVRGLGFSWRSTRTTLPLRYTVTPGEEWVSQFVQQCLSDLRDALEQHGGKDEQPVSLNDPLDPATTAEAARREDWATLARHLCTPLEVLRRRDLWLFVQEDVSLNLDQRLQRYRGGPVHIPPPASMITQLWVELNALLGAAWRERDRLWGFYQHIHGVKALPPLSSTGSCSSSAAGRGGPSRVPPQRVVLPPSASASPTAKEHYRRYLIHRYHHTQSGPTHAYDSPDDCRGFGPFKASDLGITESRHFALRDPLNNLWSSLRVEWAAAEGDAGYGGGMTTVNDSFTATAPTRGPASPTTSAGTSPFGHHQVPTFTSTHVETTPLFESDNNTPAVPYTAPEIYEAWRRAQSFSYGGGDASLAQPPHTFSDDWWNAAVVVLELALAQFSPWRSDHCHLASAEDNPAASTSASSTHVSVTSSVYADVMHALTMEHGVTEAAAQTFMYATLYHFGICDPAGTVAMEEPPPTSPSPQRLAVEWWVHLRAQFGSHFVSEVVQELVTTGLRWTRKERWEGFVARHGESRGAVCSSIDSRGVADMSDGDSSLHCISSCEGTTNLQRPLFRRDDTGGDGAHVATSYWKRRANGLVRTLQSATLVPRAHVSAKTNTNESGSHRSMAVLLDAYDQMTSQAFSAEMGNRYRSTSVVQGMRFLQRLHLLASGLTQEPSEAGHSPTIPSLGPRPACWSEGLRHPFLRALLGQTQPSSGAFLGQARHLNQHVFLSASDLHRAIAHSTQALLHEVPALHSSASILEGPSYGALHTLIGDDLRRMRSTMQEVEQRLREDVLISATLESLQRRVAAHVAELPSLHRAAASVVSPYDGDVAGESHAVMRLREVLWRLDRQHPAQCAAVLRRFLRRLHTARGEALVPIPAILRGEVWSVLLEVPNIWTREQQYAALAPLAAEPHDLDRQLAVDLPRCHQNHPLLHSAEGQERLRCLLKMWVCQNPQVGYWQGMDSVAAVLLAANEATEDATLLPQLRAMIRQYVAHRDGSEGDHERASLSPDKWQSSARCVSGVPTTPSCSAADMKTRLRHLALLLRYSDPSFAKHLFDSLGCTTELFAISWFLTVFSHALPIEKASLLWDFILAYAAGTQREHCLICVAAAMVEQHRSKLLECRDLASALSILGGHRSIDVGEVCGLAQRLLDCTPILNETSGHLAEGVPVAVLDTGVLADVLEWGCCPCWRARTTKATVVEEEADRRRRWARGGIYLIDLRPNDDEATSIGAASSGPVTDSATQSAPDSARTIKIRGAFRLPMISPLPSVGTEPSDSPKLTDAASERPAGEPTRVSVIAVEVSQLITRPHAAVLAPHEMYCSTNHGCSRNSDQGQERIPHVVLVDASSPVSVRGWAASCAASALAVELQGMGIAHVSVLAGGVQSLPPAILSPRAAATQG